MPAALEVRTDRDKLAMMLINVISNAVSYSPEGTVIEVETSTSDGNVQLTISNTARDLEERDLDVMLERFWRKDQSRTGRGHAGLGLSLVKELAQLLGIQIRLDLRGGSRFSVSFAGFEAAHPH